MKKLLLFKKPEINLLFALFITWIYMALVIASLSPFLSFSEIERQTLWVSIVYITLMLLGMFYFLLVFSMVQLHIQRLRFLIYPLILFSVPIWFILVLFGISAVALWFGFFVIPIIMIGVPLAFIIGLILDLKKKPNQF